MDWNTLWLPTATAFGLALLHSLWIGALIYAAVQTLLPVMRTAGQRHNLAYLGLLGLATGFAVAFYQNFNYTPVCENLTATSISLAELGLNLTGSAPEQTGKELTFQFLSGLAPWVSLVYLFGLLPAAVYLLRDQRRVHFLSTTGLTELPGSWTNKIVQELSDHPATKRVKTYFSAHANEVMTLGFWSPVIVFPVALINALSPEMARTILLHEIAHLRHYDHWL
ncbi:MAG: M56 family metallopeptidase, partial [Bacteroidota bacterium]